MNCDVTLKAEEFKSLHNSLYYLDCLDNEKVSELVETIRGALAGAYDQERNDFDRKYAYYSQVKEEIGAQTIWSIYEVADLDQPHPYRSGLFVTYTAWGAETQHCAVYGNTWRDLYRAADNCIRNSGDEHHVFIEGFRLDGNKLILTTGS
jgi:hypothetical protein